MPFVGELLNDEAFDSGIIGLNVKTTDGIRTAGKVRVQCFRFNQAKSRGQSLPVSFMNIS